MPHLDETLATIAQKLGLSVSQLWPQMVAVIFWQSLAWLLIDPIVLIVLAVVARHLYRWAWKTRPAVPAGEYATDDDSDDRQILATIFLIIFAVVAVVVLVTYPDQIAGVLNPQGQAAWQIFHAVGH